MTRDPDLRPPAVGGSFYPDAPVELESLVRRLLADVPGELRVVPAAMVPHAGLIYSGVTAARVLGRLAWPPVVVILAPNHTGRGVPGRASLWDRGGFDTPLGPVPIAERFGAALLARSELVAPEREAHRSEHAIEVELPFLRLLAPESAIVPLVLPWDDWARSAELGEALADVVGRWPDGALLLASSDMTHHETARSAERKDRLALATLARLDGEALLETCHRERITMCGRAAAAAVVHAARRLGATGATVLDYRHSGMVTGDDRSVVAYAGIIAG
jgi:AmmeMemoRadiSam system protein B